MKKTWVLLFVLILLESCKPGPYIPLYKFFDNNTNASIWPDDFTTIYFSRNTASNTGAFQNYHDLYVENRYSFTVEANYTIGKPFIISYRGAPIQVVSPRQCVLNSNCNNTPWATGQYIQRLAPSRTAPTFTVQIQPTCTRTVPRITRTINFNNNPCSGNNSIPGFAIIATISIPYEPVAPRNGDVFDFEITGTPRGATKPETVMMRAVYIDVQCSANISVMAGGGNATFSATSAKQVTVRDVTSGAVLYDAVLPVGTSSVNSNVPFTTNGRPGRYPFTITAQNLMKETCQATAYFTVPGSPLPCSDCAGCPPACVACPGCMPPPPPPPRCPNETLICFVIGDTVSGIEGGPQSECAVNWATFLRDRDRSTPLEPHQYIRRLDPCPDGI